MAKYAAGFDADLVETVFLEQAVQAAAEIEKMAAAVKAELAVRLADTERWRRDGDRSAAHQLARLTGSGVGSAIDTLETARRLQALPATAQAARSGRLSPQQALAVADAAKTDPASEGRLLQKAARVTLRELQEECRRTKAAADRDAEKRRQRIRSQRCLRTRTDSEGVGHLHLRHNPEIIAQLMAALSGTRERLFKQARQAGRQERPDALDADALVETILGNGQGQPKRASSTAAKLLVRVDLDTLLRGYPIQGEVCEIAGYGPVAVSAIHDLIATGDPFLAAIATKGQQVLGVAHLGRAPTAAQHSALEWLYPTCAREDCSQARRLERDHRIPWAHRKVTIADLMDRLCDHDHDLKTNHGWELTEGTGKRPFVPPTDPRHPRYRPPPADTG